MVPNYDSYIATSRTPDPFVSAKSEELVSWVAHGVFEKRLDEDQQTIGTTWVLTQKTDEKGVVVKLQTHAGAQSPPI